MATFGDFELAATGEEFEGGGHRENKHGFEFELVQFIQFFLLALRIEPGYFQLASNIKDNKWDDIVFVKYPGSDGRMLRLVQVKHFQSIDKKISPGHLLSEETKGHPFGLPKYFKSFLNIKMNESTTGFLRPNDSIEDFTMLTNTGFAYGEKCGAFELRDDIFENLGVDLLFSNNLIRFKSEFRGREELILRLKRVIVDFPYEFAHSLNEGKRYTLKTGDIRQPVNQIHAEYRQALMNEVIDQHGKKFSKDFIHDNEISRAARHFREELYSMYIGNGGNQNEESFRAYLRGQDIQRLKSKEVTLKEDLTSDSSVGVRRRIPQTADELDTEVEEFLGKLKFALRQPGIEETTQLSMKELAERFGFEEGDPSIQIAYILLRFAIDRWLTVNPPAYLTKANLEGFFACCRKNLEEPELFRVFQRSWVTILEEECLESDMR